MVASLIAVLLLLVVMVVLVVRPFVVGAQTPRPVEIPAGHEELPTPVAEPVAAANQAQPMAAAGPAASTAGTPDVRRTVEAAIAARKAALAGTPAPAACPGCEATVEPGAAFCSKCGTKL